MFDIYGTGPFQTGERKITSRDTKEQAVNFAKNLASSGYTNLRVTEGEPGPAFQPVNPPPDFRPQKSEPDPLNALPTVHASAASGGAGIGGGLHVGTDGGTQAAPAPDAGVIQGGGGGSGGPTAASGPGGGGTGGGVGGTGATGGTGGGAGAGAGGGGGGAGGAG